MFGSEAWVPVTSLGACDQSVCLEEYQLPVELDTKICLSFSCSSSVQHQESLGLFGLIVHGSAHLPIYTGWVTIAKVALLFIAVSPAAGSHTLYYHSMAHGQLIPILSGHTFLCNPWRPTRAQP